jgi:hypothetical protein
VSSGKMCISPQCTISPTAKCVCCERSYCDQCSERSPTVCIVETLNDEKRSLQAPGTYCKWCQHELRRGIKSLVSNLFPYRDFPGNQYYDGGNYDGDHYCRPYRFLGDKSLFRVSGRKLQRYRAFNERQSKERASIAIQHIQQMLVATKGSTKCSQAASAPMNGYLLVDERASTTVRAL